MVRFTPPTLQSARRVNLLICWPSRSRRPTQTARKQRHRQRHSLRLVHTQMIEYDETEDDQFTHLYTMVDGLGPIRQRFRQLRDEKHADIVGLIIDNPTGCGLSTRIGPTSDEAFFVVHHACAATTMSIAHESRTYASEPGMIALQTRTTHRSPMGTTTSTSAKWRDIMSYNAGCGGCPRIPLLVQSQGPLQG